LIAYGRLPQISPSSKEIAMSEAAVRLSFHQQADASRQLGSSFTALVAEALERVLDPRTRVGALVLGWPGDASPRGDVLALRLAGAMHALVLSGRAPALARLYPPAPAPAVDALASACREAIGEHDAFVAGFVAKAPQTNEVGRSGVLYPGLVAIARETQLPLRLYELGASAGLNLLPDRFAYDLGGARRGAAGSPVLLRPAWEGPVPEGPEPVIVARRGCDLAPVDIRAEEDRLRLRSYVWADQPERLARLDAAIGLALCDPPVIDAADAADWVECAFAAPGPDGAVRVLMHSIAFQYLPESGRSRVAEAMRAAGQRASPRSPLAWLFFEQGLSGAELMLTVWPDGRARRLATADPHARKVRWLER
jgi:hypothetical protein